MTKIQENKNQWQTKFEPKSYLFIFEIFKLAGFWGFGGMTEAGVEAFIAATGSVETTQMVQHFVDELRDRIDKVKAVDTKVSDFAKKDKQIKRKRVMIVDSDLTDFMDDE